MAGNRQPEASECSNTLMLQQINHNLVRFPHKIDRRCFRFCGQFLFQWGVVGADNKHLFVKIKRKTHWRFSLVALKLLFLKYQSHKKTPLVCFCSIHKQVFIFSTKLDVFL